MRSAVEFRAASDFPRLGVEPLGAPASIRQRDLQRGCGAARRGGERTLRAPGEVHLLIRACGPGRLKVVAGKVFAFEPDKFNIERIQKNKALNEGLTDNIIIEDLLLWDKNELIDFYEAGTVGSSAVWMPDTEHCVKKQAVTIDDWVKNNGIQKLDFIKMDIEGAEIEALDGCVETIKTLKPNFAIASYHIVNGEKTHIKLEQFFTSINYPFKTVKFKGNEIITFAGPNLK